METPESMQPHEIFLGQTAQSDFEVRPAGFWIRCMAKLADRLLLGIVSLFFIVVLALVDTFGKSGLAIFFGTYAAILLLEILYFAYFSSKGRQSFGYFMVGLRTETASHQPISWRHSLGRALLAFIFFWTPIVYLDALTLALTRSKRALHDLATRTQVMHIAAPRMNPIGFCAIGLFLLIALLLGTKELLFHAYYIASGSMNNTLQKEDRILVNRLCYRFRAPRAGEIIVFQAPPASGSGGADFVNRCIGVPGQVIEIRRGKLYRSGQLVSEPYAKWIPPPEGAIFTYDLKIVDGKVFSREYIFPETPGPWGQSNQQYAEDQERINKAHSEVVPPDQYIMLGDNRCNANDSHTYGFVPKQNFKGPAMFRYWPLERLRDF